jgi:hypothetical protein
MLGNTQGARQYEISTPLALPGEDAYFSNALLLGRLPTHNL